MSENTPKTLRRRYHAVKGERQNSDWESAMDDIEIYVRPFSGGFFQNYNTEGENRWKREEVYNSTAVIESENLAAMIQGYLVNSSDRWFESQYRVEALNRDDEAKEWLEAADSKVYQALTQSNFDIKAAEFFLDLVTYGTGVVTEETASEIEWQGLDFNTIPVRDVYFEQNHKGELRYLYRRYQWTPLQIITKFGEDNVPEYILKEVDADVVAKHEIVFCVFPRMDKDETGEVVAPEDRPWGNMWFFTKDAYQLGDEGGYYEMPAFLAHWKSTSTSKHGKSPSLQVLADIKNVNKWMEIHREGASKAVDPATLVNDRGLLSDLDLQAGGVTVVRKIEDIQVFESRGRFDISYTEIQMMEENIRTAFMSDKLGLKESPAMTATEVNERRSRMLRAMAQPLAILQRNFLDPLIRRTFMIMYRAGQFDEAPQIVRESGSETDIHYTGVLPRAQKAQVVQAEMAFMQYVDERKQFSPNAGDLVDEDKMLRNIALNMGIPAIDLRGEDEMMTVREERMAEQQRQQQLVNAEQAGKAMQEMAAGSAAIDENPTAAQALQSVG